MNQRKDADSFARALQSESDAIDRGKPPPCRKSTELRPARDGDIPLEPVPGGVGAGEVQPVALLVLSRVSGAEKPGTPGNGTDVPEGDDLPPGRWPPVSAVQHTARPDDAGGIGSGAGNRKAAAAMAQPLPPVVMEPGPPAPSEIGSRLLDRAVVRIDTGVQSPTAPPAAEVAALAPSDGAGADMAVPFLQPVDTTSTGGAARPDAQPASPARQILELLVAEIGAPHAAAPLRTLRAMLKPDHLGEVEIILRSDASGALLVRIETQLPETAERLSQDRGQIGAMLEALGIPLADGGVTVTARAGAEALPADPRLLGEGAQDSLMHPHRQSARGGSGRQDDSIAAATHGIEVAPDETGLPSALAPDRRGPGRFV